MINTTEQPVAVVPPAVHTVDGAGIARLLPGVAASSISIGLLRGDGTLGALAFGPEPFDSEVLGLRIGRIAAAAAPSRDDHRALLAELARQARGEGYAQVLRRTGFDRLPEIWALERSGFELMDVGVTFARALRAPIESVVWDDLQIRPST